MGQHNSQDLPLIYFWGTQDIYGRKVLTHLGTSKTVFLGQPLGAVVIELVQEVKTSEQHKDHHHSLPLVKQ